MGSGSSKETSKNQDVDKSIETDADIFVDKSTVVYNDDSSDYSTWTTSVFGQSGDTFTGTVLLLIIGASICYSGY